MTLQLIHTTIQERLAQLDFEALWSGFRPVKFAVYDDATCFLDGQTIPRTDEFIANTSILYQGEYIAIWKITEPIDSIDFDVLTSKIVHEMFHTFQQQSHENRYPNEIEAVQKYSYSRSNLSIKLHEAKLLGQCFISGSVQALDSFLICRKYRCQAYPYEMTYEAQVEQIEGTAQYVELLALEQLDAHKGQRSWECLFEKIQDTQSYFPIRVISYAIGAAVLRCLPKDVYQKISPPSSDPFALALLEGVDAVDLRIPEDPMMDQCLDAYHEQTHHIIQTALQKNDVVLDGEYPLLGLNIFDARCQGQYLTSTYFVMVEDQGEPRVLNGNFVLELNKSGHVVRVYNQA